MTNFKGVMHYLHRPSLINLFFAGGWVHKIEEESSLENESKGRSVCGNKEIFSP